MSAAEEFEISGDIKKAEAIFLECKDNKMNFLKILGYEDLQVDFLRAKMKSKYFPKIPAEDYRSFWDKYFSQQTVLVSTGNLKNLYDPFLWMRFNCLKAREPLGRDSLLFTTKFLEIPGTDLFDLGRMKD